MVDKAFALNDYLTSLRKKGSIIVQTFPPAVLHACASNIQKVAKEYGRSTQQVIRSVNPTGERPEETLRIFNFLVIGKKNFAKYVKAGWKEESSA